MIGKIAIPLLALAVVAAGYWHNVARQALGDIASITGTDNPAGADARGGI